MKKGCIYYTVNRVNPKIMSICQKQLRDSFNGEIVSVSTKPIDFGRNICLPDLKRSYPGMVKRILTALENSTADIVFFTEDDDLYNPTHFEFNPPRTDTFYYNLSNWRWQYPLDRAINYDTLISLSMMCCYRQLALKHFQERMDRIIKEGWNWDYEGESSQARRWGYEPGNKPTIKGGFSDDKLEIWKSAIPNIDIRHKDTYTMGKTTKKEFRHVPPPETWRETKAFDIPGWNLRKMFNL